MSEWILSVRPDTLFTGFSQPSGRLESGCQKRKKGQRQNLKSVHSRLWSEGLNKQIVVIVVFVKNYTLKCSHLGSTQCFIRLSYDVSSPRKLQNAISSIGYWLQTEHNTALLTLTSATRSIILIATSHSLCRSKLLLACRLTELTDVSTSLAICLLSVAFLRVPRRLPRNCLVRNWQIFWQYLLVATLFQSTQQCVVTKQGR